MRNLQRNHFLNFGVKLKKLEKTLLFYGIDALPYNEVKYLMIYK